MIDCGGEVSRGGGSFGGTEEVPEKGVIPMTTAVVPYGAADCVGDSGQIGDEGDQGFRLQGGVAGEGFVEVIDVGLVMAAVVDFHRQRVDVGFEGFFWVREGGEFVSHK